MCNRSAYFENAFDSGFKEAQDGRIRLVGDDAEAVDAMVMYMYTGGYQDTMVRRVKEEDVPGKSTEH